MNSTPSSKKRIITILVVLLLLLSIPLVVFLSQQQQNLKQNAASEADLVVQTLQLTDAGGNVKTTFYENEDIYVRTVIKNNGGAKGTSIDGTTTSQIFSNRASTAPDNSLSDVNISLKNGEFGAGSEFTYESRINGAGQTKFLTDPYNENALRKYSWRKATAGTYTARIFLNSDKHVTESDYINNQATVTYNVVPFTSSLEKGTTSLTQPTDFNTFPCISQNSLFLTGFTGCIQQVTNDSTKVQGKVTNNTSQEATIVIASYKAYLEYKEPVPYCSSTQCPEEYNEIWTQTFYSAKKYQLSPGKTVFISTSVPPCVWQADIFVNGLPFSFHPNINTYADGKGYVDGWYHFYPIYADRTQVKYCQPVIPSPSPSPSPSLSPSPSPSPSPSVSPSPSPSPSIPVPSEPTPSPSICPTPGVVKNIKVTCPYCKGGTT